MPKRDGPGTVVFDVGNVLLDWDPRHLYSKIFEDPGEMEWFLAEVCPPHWNVAQDEGRSWRDAEAEAIARHPGHAETIRAFRARWHEMIPSAFEPAVAALEKLAEARVPLYAITNFAADTFVETCERFAFFRLFDGIVVSGKVGILKPDPRIFHRLRDDHGVALGDCVFLDDNAMNCAAAREVGMHAIQVTSPSIVPLALRQLGFAV